MNPIYLDYNATTPVLPDVVDAMLPFLRDHYGNPSSSHALGLRTRAAIATAREQVAALIDCEPSEIVFTSGGTEANNLAIFGATEAIPGRRRLVTSTIEHPATSRPCAWLGSRGHDLQILGVDQGGRVRTTDAQAVIDESTALVAVMHSNNETGVLQPIAELSVLAHAAGALVFTDAAQSIGKVPVSVRDLGVDLLSIAGHKLYAPKGVGALYVRRGTPLAPFALGAGHERGLRPGTENVAYLVGLGVACELVGRDLTRHAERLRRLRDQLWTRLHTAIPGLALNGHAELRLPNTLNVRFPGVSGNAVLAGAPELAASTGSACHEGHESASAVILAMGIDPQAAAGSIRLTLGRPTTDADVERAADSLITSWRALSSPTVPVRQECEAAW
ncbi:MAG: cysteine desulfurase [Myxococcales bacterium]|nr:cysteine desulfurase [Myxococcales bacterium]